MRYLSPIPGELVVTSPWQAERGVIDHDGTDLRAPVGTPLVASADGVVWYADREPTGPEGRAIGVRYYRIDGQPEIRVSYLHLSRVDVERGQAIVRGQILGATGNTGHVLPAPTPEQPLAGAHLHVGTRLVTWSAETRGPLVDPWGHLEGAERWDPEQLVDGHVRPATAPVEVELVPVDTADEVDGDRRISPAERALIRDEVLDLLGAIARATSDGRIDAREVARIGLRLVDLVRTWRAGWRRDG